MARSRMADRPESKMLTSTPAAKVRIDQAHRISGSAGSETDQSDVFGNPPLPDNAPTDSPVLGASEERVLAQAAQLASVLQTRLQNLDRREANLHAASAQFETESRSVRLALQEREAALLAEETAFNQKMSEWNVRFQTQIQREEQLIELEEELQARDRQTREEVDGLEMARRTLQVERDEFGHQLQQEREAFQLEMQQEREEIEQQAQQERDALLHEIELNRNEDRERAERQQMELLAEMERQRQALFADREEFEKAHSAFEQERALWVVARTNGSQDAFDMAQDRMQLEKDRQEFLEDRRNFEEQRTDWVMELERRQIEIDRLKRGMSSATGNSCTVESKASLTDNQLTPANEFVSASQDQGDRSHDAMSALADGEETDGLPFSSLSIEEQRERLEEAANYLAREAEDLDRERHLLTEMQRRWKSRMMQQQEELQHKLAAVEQEIESRQEKLASREKQFDQQLTTVEQTRQDILKVHRESLEMRLVAEELWAQVSGKVPAAEASQAIAKLRNRLASQFKVENQQLATKKQQILELAERLNEQYEAVLRQRRELQSWGAARQIEIEQQAERLVQRELELEEQQQVLEQREVECTKEMRRLQQQVRVQTVRAA